jgi:pyruvate dehydrogenase E2 component (dihydrolipoamide acetyltransferase)
MHAIQLPALGMAPGDVYLTQWVKEAGETVDEGDVIALVETDKSEVDLVAPAPGVLGAHLVPAGASAPAGATIAWVLESGEADPVGGATALASEVIAEQAAALGPTPGGTRQRDARTGELVPHTRSPRSRASSAPTADTVVPASIDRHRAAVARAVAQSWAEIPHFAVSRELRVERLQDVHRSFRAIDATVTLTDVLLKAYALALVERFETTEIDLGLAVATDRGVAIPVLRDVARAGVLRIARARRAAAERARAGRSDPDDAVAPHGTVSNLGAYGVDSFTGIVPLGQTSILTVGAAAPRPVVEDGGLAVGVTMSVTLNVDHREWDGQHAAEALRRLAGIIAEPAVLLAID